VEPDKPLTQANLPAPRQNSRQIFDYSHPFGDPIQRLIMAAKTGLGAPLPHERRPAGGPAHDPATAGRRQGGACAQGRADEVIDGRMAQNELGGRR